MVVSFMLSVVSAEYNKLALNASVVMLSVARVVMLSVMEPLKLCKNCLSHFSSLFVFLGGKEKWS
jgi:hypothetical protein